MIWLAATALLAAAIVSFGFAFAAGMASRPVTFWEGDFPAYLAIVLFLIAVALYGIGIWRLFH